MIKNKKLIIILGSAVIVAIAAFLVIKSNKTSYIKSVGQSNNGSSSTSLQSKLNPTKPKTNSASTTTNSTSSSTNTSSSTSSNSNLTLIAPTGSFVSNHNPVLSNPRMDTEQSTCNTTPGASCNIVFTNTSTNAVISLGSKIADFGGAVYWTWTLQGVGLTQGSWKIMAVANLNQQSKSTSDQLLLNISQ